jgi:hypothetical protein
MTCPLAQLQGRIEILNCMQHQSDAAWRRRVLNEERTAFNATMRVRSTPAVGSWGRTKGYSSQPYKGMNREGQIHPVQDVVKTKIPGSQQWRPRPSTGKAETKQTVNSSRQHSNARARVLPKSSTSSRLASAQIRAHTPAATVRAIQNLPGGLQPLLVEKRSVRYMSVYLAENTC